MVGVGDCLNEVCGLFDLIWLLFNGCCDFSGKVLFFFFNIFVDFVL